MDVESGSQEARTAPGTLISRNLRPLVLEEPRVEVLEAEPVAGDLLRGHRRLGRYGLTNVFTS